MPTRAEARRNLRAIIAETLHALGKAPQRPATKSISGYVADYLAALTGLVTDVINGDADRADMARRHRALLTEYAADTYREGMWESGEYANRGEVADNYEADDEEAVAAWIADQRQYVAEYAKAAQNAAKLFAADDPGADAAQADVLSRADLWAASLRNLGDQGKLSAMGNPFLTFDGDDGEESCVECQRYKGQRHRRKWWEARGLLARNGNENFTCGRWEPCNHNYYDDDGKRVI